LRKISEALSNGITTMIGGVCHRPSDDADKEADKEADTTGRKKKKR